MMKKGFWLSYKDVLSQGAYKILDDLWNIGVNKVSLFVAASGKIYFNPKERYFSKTNFKVFKGLERDLLREFLEVANSFGIHVTATIVCVVDPVHATNNPNARLVDIYGTSHSYGLCPNNPDLREYLKGLARNLALEYDIDEVELDYIRYKRSRDEKLLPLHLLMGRYCYCSYCRDKAQKYGIEWDKLIGIAKEIFELSKTSVDNMKNMKMYFSTGGIAGLYSRNSILSQWLEFRGRCIYELVREIKENVKETGVKLSADLFYPTLSWQVGQDYKKLALVLDSAKPMIYTARMGAWETRYIRRLLRVLGEEYINDFEKYLSNLLGIKIRSLDEFELKGAPPEVAYRESYTARKLMGDKVKIYTGLYSGYDPSIVDNNEIVFRKTIKNALKADIDGLYFFSYSITRTSHKKIIKEIS